MFRKRYHFSDFFWYQGGNTQTPIQCLNKRTFRLIFGYLLEISFFPWLGLICCVCFCILDKVKFNRRLVNNWFIRSMITTLLDMNFLLTKGIPFGYRNVRCWETSNIHWSNVSYNQRLCHSFIHVCRILGKASFKWNI